MRMPWSRSRKDASVSRRKGLFVLLICLCCISLGLAVGVFVVPGPVPENLRQTSVGGEIPVVQESFDDVRTVKAQPSTADGQSVVWAGGGIVTKLGFGPQSVLSSGESPFSVDGRPIIALHTSVPLYRDLSAGMVGEDVGALRDELMRLGFGGDAAQRLHNTFDRRLRLALIALQKSVGASRTGALQLTDCVWLPGQSVTLAASSLVLGQSAPQELGRTSMTVSSLQVRMPDDLYPGKRVVDVGGAKTDLPSDGVITDRDFLNELVSTDAFAQWSAAGAEQRAGGLSATLRLEHALDATKVPAGAVFGINGRRACVRNGGKSVAVDLYGSDNGFAMIGAKKQLSSVQVPVRAAMRCPASAQVQ